jgi:hypothetical protein
MLRGRVGHLLSRREMDVTVGEIYGRPGEGALPLRFPPQRFWTDFVNQHPDNASATPKCSCKQLHSGLFAHF